MKAITKKDIGGVKKGTLLEYTGGVFAYEETTFLAEDVLSDEVHFELVEHVCRFGEVVVDEDEEKTIYIRA